jgi:phosphatidate cytidylyltransferase
LSGNGGSGNPLFPQRNWADLGPRIASGLVLIALTALALVLGSFLFSAVVGAVFAGVYREWETMVTRAPLKPVSWTMVALVALAAFLYPAVGPLGAAGVIAIACVIAAFSGREEMPWRIGGLAFYGLVIVAILGMRGTGTAGIWAGLYLGTTVWMTDSAAFFTGRQIGGEKLAPDISPSKTWSGALGGLALGTLAGTFVWILATDSPIWLGAVLSVLISILSQLGDLTESAIKRRFRIKDSGDIIPGHGGLMDRLDSLTYSALFLAALGMLHAGFGAIAEGFLYW